jgi:plastocyanin
MALSRIAKVMCLASAMVIVVGCSTHRFETGYHDFNKVQLQFYAPEGATVAVGDQVCCLIVPDRSHQINMYSDRCSRLEHNPEETATFNLAPGHYEFKYTGGPGFDGANIYGNIEIYNVCDLMLPGASTLVRKTFIPIALPNPCNPCLLAADGSFPYASPGRLVRISAQEADQLASGDMVTKVVFIADMKKARHDLDKLEVDYTCMVGKHQRLRSLLSEAQLDAIDDPGSKTFIKIQCELKELDQKMQRNRDRVDRLQALLNADKVLLRRGMVVLATDEVLPANEDPVAAARELGQVVVVIHIGGRHLHWGNPAQEATVYNR